MRLNCAKFLPCPSLSLALMLAMSVSTSIHGQEAAQATETEEKVEYVDLDAGNGKLALAVPKDWAEPKAKTSRMLEYELYKPVKAEPTDQVRVTMMAAGGSIDANIERWYMQFAQPDGESTKAVSKVEKIEVDGATIHRVEIPGNHTMSIGGGPFAPGKKVEIKEARMLAAIVELEGGMKYFIKLTGPDALVKKEAKHFDKMLKEMKIKL